MRVRIPRRLFTGSQLEALGIAEEASARVASAFL